MRMQTTPAPSPQVTVPLRRDVPRLPRSAPIPIRQDADARLRLVIADPDPLSRRVVRDALEATAGMAVAAEASDGPEAVELICRHRPDIALAETSLRGLDDVALIRRVREQAPDVHVVLLTVDADKDLALRALRAGADGVLSKHLPLESIARALQGVRQGQVAISRCLALALVQQFRNIPEGFAGMRPVRSPLTPREWEVLDLVSTGATTQEIATALVLTEDTVYSHVKSILRKLGVHTRAEAVALVESLRQPQYEVLA